MKSDAFVILLMVILCGGTLVADAESWPSLESYASNCVLVVKARQTGECRTNEGSFLKFEVIETWKGRFDPQDFIGVTPQGYIRAAQGQHGVRVKAGQEIKFFFTRHNQPAGKLRDHSTAFPIIDGRIIYAATDNPEVRREMSVGDFKKFFDKFTTKQ